jgi:hypothetical protein
MKCRCVNFATLLSGSKDGANIFPQFTFQYPDFIEFDELNSKIVTKHSQEKAFRVWEMKSYQLSYVLK